LLRLPIGTLNAELQKQASPLADHAGCIFADLLTWLTDQFRAFDWPPFLFGTHKYGDQIHPCRSRSMLAVTATMVVMTSLLASPARTAGRRPLRRIAHLVATPLVPQDFIDLVRPASLCA
jgi:hypothetical protein